MKIKTRPLIASISLVVFGMSVVGFLGIHNKLVNLRHAYPHQILGPDSDLSFQISKGTILLLLSLGVIGALRTLRKNSSSRSTFQKKASQTPYDLKFNPFCKPVDMKYFWWGESHSQALDALKKAAWSDANFLILSGASGVGKTTLIKYLKKELLPEYICVEIGNEFQDTKDLYLLIASRTGINKNFNSKGAFFIHFNQYLHSMHAENKKILFILDDFTAISDKLIKELTFLSNITIRNQKIIKVLFAGENISFSLGEPHQPPNSSVVTCRLKRLNTTETNSYIDYMLAAAGTKNSIFSQEAIQKIFLFSQGIPREINKICDCALNLGNEQKLRTIDPAIIEECCQELNLLRAGQANTLAKIPRKANQTKDLFDHFLNRFKTWKLFDQPRNFPDINKQTVIDGFRKAVAKSHSFIQSAIKYFYLKERNYRHSQIFISRLFDSYLWNSALAVSLVALALIFALWYQGILPLKPDAPNFADFQKNYYLPKSDKEIFKDKEIIQPSKQPDIKAMKQLGTEQQLNDVNGQNELKSKLAVNEIKSAKSAYFIQVGAFFYKKNALKTARMLKKKGYSAKIVSYNDSKNRLWHTVRIGEYASLKAATKHAADFSKREKMDSIVLPLGQQ